MTTATTPDSDSIPERSLNRQVVLEEDEYTAALSHIIARDFFPSLVHLDATNEYLDALHSRDPHLINASVRRLEQISSTPLRSTRRRVLQTPSQTPYAAGPSDTPLRGGSGEPPTKKARYDNSLGLDEFQARYTSEDNSSFTQILDEENRQRKEKWRWAWEAQKRVEAQKGKMIEARERMLIEAPQAPGVREKLVIEAPKPAGLLTDGKDDHDDTEEEEAEKKGKGGDDHSTGKELVISAATEEKEQVDVMAPKKDKRAAGVDGWHFKARNSLMFPPDADSSPYHEKPRTDIVPKGEERTIHYSSTRLPEQDDSANGSQSLSSPPSPTRSRIDAAIQGTPYRPRSPTVNSFSYVPTLPSPTPAELGPAAVKQLMTWGTLNATPRILSRSDDPATEDMAPPNTPFRISEPSSREALSHRLSSKAAKSLRAKAGLLGLGLGTPGKPLGRKSDMGPPSTPRRAEAAGNLTPAAKRLLNRSTMGTLAARRAEAMEKAAGWDGKLSREKDMSRVRWTPSPLTRRQ